MPFSSSQPSIIVPAKETLWSWLFDSEPATSRQIGASKGIRDGDTGTLISYGDMKNLSTLLSTALARRFELGAGDQLMIACQNTVWYPVVMFAGLRIGCVVSAVSPTYLVDEMVHAIKVCCPKVIVVDTASYNETRKAARMLGVPESGIICMEKVEGLPSIHDLILEVKSDGRKPVPKWELSASQTSQNTCALICFSSGTTGLPKAAMISNANLIAQSYQVRTNRGHSTYGAMFSPLPLYHITGLVQIMILPILLNQNVVIIRRFNLSNMLATVTRYQCEELWLVPPILIRMVNDPVVRKYDLGNVVQFNTGAAPLSPRIIEKLTVQFPHVVIKQHWGMTESTSCITATPVALLENMYAHTVGTIVSSTTIKIINPETDKEVGLDESGEILARGPQIFMGYVNNDVATRQAIDEDGYLHTGDLGSMDANGLVTIHDRMKELIKVKGVGVAPAELESTLHGHPAVKDVAVIGISDQSSGEIPKAFVVLQPDVPRNSPTAVDLVEYVKSKVSRPKWIDGGVEFLDEIPKSPSGKILRRVLKDQLKRREESQARASRL